MPGLMDFLEKTEAHHSIFENEIRMLEVPTCAVFLEAGVLRPVSFKQTEIVLSTKDTEAINANFQRTQSISHNRIIEACGINVSPLRGKRVAVLFSGGPAAGGHNVIAGIRHIMGTDNRLYGVKAGPGGLLKGQIFEITDGDIKGLLNTGGFDFLGSDRTKINKPDQFEKVRGVCRDNNLDAIVIIGGDDSNTNAAVLAEKLFEGIKSDGSGVQVIGVPKTIDGDLQVGGYLPISFGYDTATKIYAEMVGNILQDTPSSRKYWHFIKLMGRSASHVTLEVALQTKPPVSLISEEVAERGMSLEEIVDHIANIVIRRSLAGMNYGVVLVPEGLIEFIPEMTTLIAELNAVIADCRDDIEAEQGEEKREFIKGKLTSGHAKLMGSLPDYIVDMLLAERDAHGNLQVSLIPTEQLLIDMTKKRVKQLDSSVKFSTQKHFFGYEGRCGAPSRFDAMYTYNLGLTAGSLVLAGKTGYIASITELDKGGKPIALPLTGLLCKERRKGKEALVIKKALVTLDSPAFQFFASRRGLWADLDRFSSPGPRQLWGKTAKQFPITIALNQGFDSLFFGF